MTFVGAAPPWRCPIASMTLQSTSDDDVSPRIYRASWAMWWTAAIFAFMVIGLLLSLTSPARRVFAIAIWQIAVAVLVLPLLITILFLVAGVLIRRRRRAGAIVGAVSLVICGMSLLIGAFGPRPFPVLRAVFAIPWIVACVFVVQAWPELSRR